MAHVTGGVTKTRAIRILYRNFIYAHLRCSVLCSRARKSLNGTLGVPHGRPDGVVFGRRRLVAVVAAPAIPKGPPWTHSPLRAQRAQVGDLSQVISRTARLIGSVPIHPDVVVRFAVVGCAAPCRLLLRPVRTALGLLRPRRPPQLSPVASSPRRSRRSGRSLSRFRSAPVRTVRGLAPPPSTRPSPPRMWRPRRSS